MTDLKVTFLVVGAQKGGTTSIAKFLTDHPDICMAKPKAVHFFDDEPRFKSGGDYAYYHSHFDYQGEAQVGEATPIYMFYEHLWGRISRYNPDLKLIVLLRDPIARAYSHYTMARKNRREWLPFGWAIRVEPLRVWRDRNRLTRRSSLRLHTYVSRGLYLRQIQNMLKYFPRENILFLKSEDLSDHHDRTMATVFEFLGVDSAVTIAPERLHTNQYPKVMSDADRRYLADKLHPQLDELEALLGWDLTAWRG